ncbi:MAG: SpoIIE family protein phosphatase, partial [Armatimonadota bacterium]
SLPFSFWAVDANGRYIMQNSVAEAGWGSAIGKNVDELSLSPDVLDLWTKNNDIVFSGEIVNGETSYVINGEILYHNYVISPVKDGDNITGAVGISIDITDKKRLIDNLQKNESALRESHRILEALMEYIPDGIAIVDEPDISVKWISRYACELQGSTREESQGNNVISNIDHNVYHLDGRPATLMELPITRAVKSGETVINEEWVIHSPSGNTVPILVNAAPVKDEGGSIIGGILAWRDITSIKEVHKALENAFHREHHIADVLQRALIPDVDMSIPGYSLTARYRSALDEAVVGGDFYDIFTLPDGRIALLLGDISGKGLTAAVYTAMAKYMLRAYVHEDPSPSYVMAQLNESMCDYTPEDVFATVFYGILDPMKRTLIYANAGHDEPILFKNSTQSISLLDVTGRAVGIFKGCSYDVKSIRMKCSDVLAIYTDGVTDSRRDGLFFGIDGISDVLQSHIDSDSESIADAILNAAKAAGGNELHDDAAVLIINVKSFDTD